MNDLLLRFIFLGFVCVPAPAWCGFGVVADERSCTVDSGAGLVVTVQRASGGITSIHFKGTELNGPRSSGIASGLGEAGTSVKVAADDNKVAITISTDRTNAVVKDLTHYYIVRKGENTLYMATHAEAEPRVGELRWIARLKSSLFPNAPKESDLRGTTGAIESSDVFGFADKSSRSKYYGNERAMDLGVRGVTGKQIGVFMVYGSRESSAGGPFFRDIQNQTGESNAEVYNYMNSGHNQTEPLRLGALHGPYALVFTDGSTPNAPDVSFIAGLGLKGYIRAEQRGGLKLEGVAGRDAQHAYLASFSNKDAQYWTGISDSTTCTGLKPGNYAVTIYKGELMVHRTAVTVKAGETATVPAITITRDPSQAKALWRIGDWDGTPLEFRNGRNISLMHPSDARQAPWNVGEFIVGRSGATDFPACQWRNVNNGQIVRFTLSKEQVTDCELRIGITAGFAGGRPRVRINQWESRLLDNVRQPDSRSITIGTYRGHNVTCRFNVPAKALVEGENELAIHVVSGQQGSDFLSPGYAIDCVDLCPRR